MAKARTSKAASASRSTDEGHSFWDEVRKQSAYVLGLIRTRAETRSPNVLLAVGFLTLSLGLDAMFRAGFVPLLAASLGYIGFVIHEFGHLATRMLPEGICTASGTLFQLALPAGSIFMFIRQRDDAAACFAACWLSLSLMHTADYMADARAQVLDMSLAASFWELADSTPVRPEDLGHDWNYMLQSCGLLSFDKVLANGVRMLAGSLVLCAVMANTYMVYVSGRRHWLQPAEETPETRRPTAKKRLKRIRRSADSTSVENGDQSPESPE